MSGPAEWFLVIVMTGTTVVGPAGDLGQPGVAVGPIKERDCRDILQKKDLGISAGYVLTCRQPQTPVCITQDVAAKGTFKLCRELAPGPAAR